MPGYPCCCTPADECSTLFNVGAVDQFQISVPAALFDANAGDAGEDDQWCNDTECDAKTGTFLLDPETQGNLTRGPFTSNFVCGYKSATFQACQNYSYNEFTDTWSINEDNYHWELIFSSGSTSEFYRVILYLLNEDFPSYDEQFTQGGLGAPEFTPTLNVTTGFTVRHLGSTSAGFEFCDIDATEDITITEAP